MFSIGSISQELVSGLVDVLNDRLVRIILYGSTARGTESQDSDIDIAMIVEGKLTPYMEDLLSDFIVDMNLKYNKVFSIIDIEEPVFEQLGDVSPFYRNVKKEGIVFWEAAEDYTIS